LSKQGYTVPQLSCYEKQSEWGGQWNFSNKTGYDEFGEPVHSCMYRDLLLNSPKEVVEYGDYTFDDHFGGPVSSYQTRETMFEYFQGEYIHPSDVHY
jgi:trimethylamine monooxygenase